MLLQAAVGYLASELGSYGVAFFGAPLPDILRPDPETRPLLVATHHTLALAVVALVAFHLMEVARSAFSNDGAVLRMLPLGGRARSACNRSARDRWTSLRRRA